MIPDYVLGALVLLLATSAGACAAFFLNCMEKRKYAVMLAFAAGAMAFSAMEMLSEAHGSAGDATVAGGFVAGFIILMMIERLLPHVHLHITKKEITKSRKKAALIAGTISLHNVPEGLAVATAFAASGPLGWFVATAIALQDVPEGALVSTPLACYGLNRNVSVLFGVFSGAVEAVAAIVGYLFLSAFSSLVPAALAFSAGAMAYVILVEILPDALESGMERLAALGFVAGVAATAMLAGMLIA
jgi:ZIP family zinc transporter